MRGRTEAVVTDGAAHTPAALMALLDWEREPRLVAAREQAERLRHELLDREGRRDRARAQLQQADREIENDVYEQALKGLSGTAMEALQRRRQQLEREVAAEAELASQSRAALKGLDAAIAVLEGEAKRMSRSAALQLAKPVVMRLLPLLREAAALNVQLRDLVAGPVYASPLRSLAWLEIDPSGGGDLTTFLKDIESIDWNSVS